MTPSVVGPLPNERLKRLTLDCDRAEHYKLTTVGVEVADLRALLAARAEIARLEGELKRQIETSNERVLYYSRLATDRGCRLSVILDHLISAGIDARFNEDDEDQSAPIIEDAIQAALAQAAAKEGKE